MSGFIFIANAKKLSLVLVSILWANILYADQNDYVDFSSANIVTADEITGFEETAIQMLVEEVESRTLIHIPVTSKLSDDSGPVIVIGTRTSLGNYNSFEHNVIESSIDGVPEGFSIQLVNDTGANPTIYIVGNDARGVFYGIGHFLRKSVMEWNKLDVPSNINIETYPRTALRGHQMGYRPKVNSYDGFTVEMWEQYIRDLVVFGVNAIELMPPNTDDQPWSPMFPLSQIEMMVEMNELLIKYNLDTWIWYPLMYGDYTQSEDIEQSLAENEEIFSQLSKVDAIFIPGGDPGSTHPVDIFNYLEKQAEVLHKHHPSAEIWVSPQSFNKERMDIFLELVRAEPEWLSGIVYGPQVRLYVDQLREVIPEKYPIRRYPDITHTYDSQYPVPNWDHAFAATQNREPINPRPMDQAAIFHAPDPINYHGFITYSEGVNDDVNKIIWSALGWNPETEVIDILHDYSRYFIGPEFTYDFAQGILDLENNWNGPLLSNASVYSTLGKFESMENRASPQVRMNWRFILAQYRAYYDAYIRSRLIYETHLEDQAMGMLRQAPRIGSMLAVAQAESILLQSVLNHTSPDWRQRLFELAEALFQSIRMQKSADKYFASGVRRGANLDLVDWPLNDRIWLTDQFIQIKKIEDEEARLNEIDKIVNWKNPGPGGFYTDLGDLGNQPNVIIEDRYDQDPAFLSSTFVGFAVQWPRTANFRVSWARYMQTLYDQPLKMHYSNLDSTAEYMLKATYSNQYQNQSVRLIANGEIEVHPYIVKDFPVHQIQVDIPRKATENGELTLEWIQDLGMGGTGRGNQLAEVWLIKKTQ